MLDAILGLGSVSSSLNSMVDLYKNVSGVFKGDQKNQYLEKMTNHLGGIETHLERLSDKILIAPDMQIVQDVTKTSQQKIENLKEVKTCLEPIQQAIGEEILSSAMILTPEKMQQALVRNPWEVLIDVRPINLVTSPNNPDLVPVAFYHDGYQFIGWQMRGTLPILFDCQFDMSPSSQVIMPEIKAKSVKNKVKIVKPIAKEIGEEFSFEVVKVDARGKIYERKKHTAKQRIENAYGVNLAMVYIPAGEFMMGSPEDEEGRYDNESPQHKVTIKQPFYMSKYPITQAQWQAVMGNNPSHFKGDKRPVGMVSWDDAVKFCEKLSKLTKQNYRLPSEAEWEYACRVGTTTPFYFGETITTDLANYCGNKTYGSGPHGFLIKN
ncbi:formylglycine-generating enzyme family protein [Candidatus Halobeggiatoa sp. HSG11]|nr:formylglycine-generating enzyme family protein [Candidatus Halobeggiatoa sp. HSG11]